MPRGVYQPKLQNVQWRFLSDQALGPTTATQPWSDESKKRISHLEKALASTHDLEAQYQSFLQEVSKIDPSGTTYDGVGPGWAGMPAGGARHGGMPAVEADLIPSDPIDTPAAGGGGGGGFGGPSGFAAAPMAADASGASGSGGEPAMADAHSNEDEEVARVQALAAAAGGDGKGESDSRDSPSPVIIWRHAAPVKIATNIPADLLTDGESAARQRSRRLHQQTVGLGASHGGISAPGGGEVASRPINPATKAYNRRMAYGVWYLPKEQWESRAQAAGEGIPHGGEASSEGGAASSAAPANAGGGSSKDVKDGGGKGKGAKGEAAKGGAAGGEGEVEGASLADTIPKLYSSRIYRDYLKTQKYPNNRIPSYLQRVDSPKAALSPRRGNIPMIDKGDGAGPDSPSVPPSREP